MSTFSLPPDERRIRAAAKRRLILEFLGTGETWTTLVVVEALLSASRWTAKRTVTAMVRDGLLREASLTFAGVRRLIYGITPTGCAELGQFGADAWPFVQPPAPDQYEHHIALQRAHLVAMAKGWDWLPQRVVSVRREELKLKKLPDAIATTPKGTRLAIEIERTLKSRHRYAEAVGAHLADVTAGRYAQVHYISPDGKAETLRRAFNALEFVKVAGDLQKMDPAKHLAAIRFYNQADWPTPSTQQQGAAP